jgi:carbon-monoxide dehydrogenase large subunit
MSERILGEPRKRVEDPRLVRGEGRYVDDLGDACLHAVFVRSPHPHARIVAIDAAAALAAPGVIAVFDAKDVPPSMPPIARPLPEALGSGPSPLATDTARFVGEPIAVVVANTRAQANDAAALVDIAYEPLPAVSRPADAIAEGAPWLHADVPSNTCYRVQRTCGDVDGAFARAAHRVTARVKHSRIAGVPMETRGLLAEPSGDGLLIHASTQAPHGLRRGLAAALGMEPERIRVVAPDVGGGFGVKGGVYREDVVVSAIALRLQRPVKWVATRIEDMLTTQQARDQEDSAEAALDADGRILALRVRTVGNIGAYLHGSAALFLRIQAFATGAYRIPALATDTLAVFTNTNVTGAFRGAGRPEAAAIIERVMDSAARQLGLDPAEIRRRNFIQPDEFPYTTPCGTPFDSGDYPRLLQRALDAADYDELKRSCYARRRNGEIVGVGLTTFIEQTGAGSESGSITVETDGSITAVIGSSTQGQGHQTVFAQIVADRFGVPFEAVTLRQGDTSLIPTGTGTFGSRSTVVGGGAVVTACDNTIDQALDLAARELEVSRADVEWRDGAARVIGASGRSLDLAQLASVASAPLASSVVWESPMNGPTTAGAYVASVVVDRETGRLTVEKLVAVDDFGVVVNPRLAAGQRHGALANGFGEATSEAVVYADGQPLSASLLDYALPTASSVVDWQLDNTVTPSPLNPIGVKGIGEAGPIGVPAVIASAVLDALAPFGVTEIHPPITSRAIWEAIRSQSA